MDSIALHTISVFITLLALYNPISNTAIFFALSATKDKYERKKIAIKSIYTAFIIISVFCVLGKAIFEFIAIPVSSFQVMGGIFILFIGIQMLIRKQKKTQENGRSFFNNKKRHSTVSSSISTYGRARSNYGGSSIFCYG